METPLTRIKDIAWIRLRAPDLDLQERFLTNFGMVRSARTENKLFMRGTGYLGTGRDTRVIDWFTITQFQHTAAFEWLVTNWLAMSFEEWETPIDFIHKDFGGNWVLPALVSLHIGAALFHHFIKQDDVLFRMLPGRQQ